MHPKYVLILALTFPFLSTSHAQNQLTVTGVIVDSQSKAPLEYANISILGKGLGTVSNTEGKFEFHIPDNSQKDSLAVSFIGYSTYTTCVCDIPKGKILTILLTPANVELARIVVSTKPYTVHSLLQEVVDNYSRNYSTQPHQLDAFYRETRKEGEKYGYLLEAAVRVYQESFQEPYVVELNEVRINAYDVQFDYATNENFLRSLLMNDYIGSPYSGFFKRYSKKKTYVIEDTTSMDNVPVFVISAGQLPDWKETIYVNASDLAIVRFEGESRYGADGNLEMVKVSRNKLSRYRYLKVVNTFRKVGDKYFPGYVRMRLDHDIYDKATGTTERYKIIDREVMTNDVYPANTRPHNAMQSISLETQLKSYNPEFWKSYTILLRTPDQDKIASDLEERVKLEEQFSKQKPRPPVKGKH